MKGSSGSLGYGQPWMGYYFLHSPYLERQLPPCLSRVTPQGKNGREKEIRRQLERYFRRYQFNENAAKTDTRTVSTSTPSLGGTSAASGHQRKSRPVRSAKSGQSRSQQPVLSDGYYTTQTKGGSRKLKPEASGGFGVGLKKRKGAFRGGQPVLRSAPPTGTSRHETERLVNIASRLLVATETIDLKNPPTGKYQGQKEKDENRGAPRNFESGPRGRHSVYTYDINGRRMLLRRRDPSETPPRSPTPPGNYVTITGEQADDQVMPHWLRKKLAEGGAGDPDRPQSAYGATTPRPPDEDSRPHSAVVIRPRPKRTSSESEPEQPGQAKQGWGSSSPLPGYGSDTGSAKTETGVQTGGELLKNYEPSECILEDGERNVYEVHVFTGTRLGASTKADIKIALFGDKGRTKDIFLEKSSSYKIKFQKGQEDIFKLDTFYVGPIKKIAIGHDRNELGFGWYLARVEVRDMDRRILYSIPCERWLSPQDPEKRTYRELDVDYSTSFNPEISTSPEPLSEPAPEPQDASPRTERSSVSHSDASSRTSVATNYSDRSDRSSSKGKRTPPRRPSYTSQSSEYTSSTVSSASSSRSSSPLSTPRKPIEEETEEDEKKEEAKPKPPPVARPLQRRDTFFDQRTAGPDYTSVIDGLSTSTEDRRDSQDFDPVKPLYEEKDPTGKPLTLIEDEDTAHLEVGDPADREADKKEEERVGVRLSIPAPPPPPPAREVTRDIYLDGFKAGIQAAKTKNKEIPVAESDSESEDEQGPTIHEATKTGDLQKVKKILNKGSGKKDAVDERGWAPVHIAATGGHTDIIKWLAVTNADLNVETPTSYTAMHLAAMHGHTNTMIVLFAMGAKLASKTVEQQAPLHIAAAGGHLETVKWLVANRAPLDNTDNLGRTPLDLAKEHSHHDVADFLRSCQQEQQRPGSGLSLIRSNSKQSLSDKEEGSFGRAYAKYASDTDSTDSEDDDPGWLNDHTNRPTTSMGRRGSVGRSDTETESKTEIKHDEELMEKRQVYDDQKRRMSEKNVSFLDAIRDEVG